MKCVFSAFSLIYRRISFMGVKTVCVITADYHGLPQTNISSPQTNSDVWGSYLEDGTPQTTFYLPQTNSTWWESYL